MQWYRFPNLNPYIDLLVDLRHSVHNMIDDMAVNEEIQLIQPPVIDKLVEIVEFSVKIDAKDLLKKHRKY
jgi:hypothetical protein